MPSATARLVSWISSCQSTGSPRSRASSASSGAWPGRVDEHPVDQAERVVAGGAGGRPGRRQLLAGLEDLLDQHVGAAGQRGEVVEVAARVAQAVGVVDAQPVDEALVEPAQDLDVGSSNTSGSSTRIAGQRVDREEAPVVELGVGDRQSTSS